MFKTIKTKALLKVKFLVYIKGGFMQPYCPNNSNFTFREITCAPIKKPCDSPKPPQNCNNGFGWCEDLINCFTPNCNCPQNIHWHQNDCGCNKANNSNHNNQKNDEQDCFFSKQCNCPICSPKPTNCSCPKCCPKPKPSCLKPCHMPQPPFCNKRPIIIILKK